MNRHMRLVRRLFTISFFSALVLSAGLAIGDFQSALMILAVALPLICVGVLLFFEAFAN